jgi:hypothetical protein
MATRDSCARETRRETRRLLAFGCCALVCLQLPRPAFAVCRIVEPIGESGGIAFDPTRSCCTCALPAR